MSDPADDAKTEDRATSAAELRLMETGETSPVEHYRVYKRRFAGLAVLCLLNIVVSWCWLTYAPVARDTAEYYGLGSETPVNWLSTVVLFAYCVSTP